MVVGLARGRRGSQAGRPFATSGVMLSFRAMDLKVIRRIVVATDFSDLAGEAVETAVAFARAVGATLDLVHVATETAYPVPPPMDMLRMPFDLPSVVAEASSRLQIEEDRVRAEGVACESNVLVGRPDTEIVEHADRTRADLVILGTHGRSGLSHALLGSVAERVVQHARCPVLTVPARWRAHREGEVATTPA
jgi:nucleotide-binding universal stress UspA family protein